MTVRAKIKTDIQPHLPRGWKLIPYDTNLDRIDTHVVMISQESIESSAPVAGAVTVNFKIIVIEPKTDPGPAEDALDDAVIDLLLALKKSRQLAWTRADRSVWNESNPSYEITAMYYATPDTP